MVMFMNILSEKIITAYDSRNYLKDIPDDELTFEQKITKDFLNKFYELDEKTYEEVRKSLSEKFSEHLVAMILNVLPEYEEQVMAIFAKERNKPSDEDIKFILDEVSKLIK